MRKSFSSCFLFASMPFPLLFTGSGPCCCSTCLLNRIKKCRSIVFNKGITSRVINFFPLSTGMPFFMKAALLLFALCRALRISNDRPSLAIFNTFKLALPGEGSKYSPVEPLNCTISNCSFTTTPTGVYFESKISSALF